MNTHLEQLSAAEAEGRWAARLGRNAGECADKHSDMSSPYVRAWLQGFDEELMAIRTMDRIRGEFGNLEETE